MPFAGLALHWIFNFLKRFNPLASLIRIAKGKTIHTIHQSKRNKKTASFKQPAFAKEF